MTVNTVEAQDMVTDYVYSDGRIVFKARKIQPFGDKNVRIVTGMGRFIYVSNETKFVSLNK